MIRVKQEWVLAPTDPWGLLLNTRTETYFGCSRLCGHDWQLFTASRVVRPLRYHCIDWREL